MKLTSILFAAGFVCAVIFCGCNADEAQDASLQIKESPTVVDLYTDLAIQNAIIKQRTLYPYHFVNNSASLNTLGQRDMAVLAAHFAQNPGQLTVRRGEEDGELYKARLETVKARLASAGIEPEQIRMNDSMAGGDGMSTSDIIDVMVRSRDPLTQDQNYGTSFVSQ